MAQSPWAGIFGLAALLILAYLALEHSGGLRNIEQATAQGGVQLVRAFQGR